MSEPTAAPNPQPAAAPTPAAEPTPTTALDSPPPPQPGAIPQAPSFPAPTLAPEVLPPTVSEPTAAADAEPTPAPESAAIITPGASATTAEAVPEPTPAPTATAPLAEPVVTAAAPTPAVIEPSPISADITQIVPSVAATFPTSTLQMAAQQPLEPTATQKSEAVSTVPASEAGPEVPEPESPLTKKFTEAEWTALKEFRTQLPDIFAEAYPDNATARDTPIKFWGVDIDPKNPKSDARVSIVLMKFLRANNLHVPQTREKYIGTLRWRESFNIPAALEEDFPKDVFESLAHIYGHDNDKRPVVYNIYGGNQDLKAVFGDVQRFIRWRVALMEKSVSELDFTGIDQMLQIHDYEGVSLTSRDANSKAAASEATNIFQNHYPELLYKKFFINVPTLLNWIFWLFKPVISANTLAKMTVVGTGQHAIKKALSEYINVKELPKRYGGEAEAF